VFLFLFSVLLSISSGTTLRFSSIKQKLASQQYCCEADFCLLDENLRVVPELIESKTEKRNKKIQIAKNLIL
jgi:hypothetical protein